MAIKGQTCLTCNATCCRLRIEYHHPKDKIKIKRVHSYSRKELLSLGFKEVVPEFTGQIPCGQLAEDGLCSLQNKHKPKLCSSWWCHGKLWQPKRLHNQEHKTETRTTKFNRNWDTKAIWCFDCNNYINTKRVPIGTGG